MSKRTRPTPEQVKKWMLEHKFSATALAVAPWRNEIDALRTIAFLHKVKIEQVTAMQFTKPVVIVPKVQIFGTSVPLSSVWTYNNIILPLMERK